jgi:SPP1 family predicted phage head-tail adaptor
MPSIKSNIGKEPYSLDDVCYLVSIHTEKDELGQTITRDKKLFMVFCQRLSVTRAEFNAASQAGHKPNFMLIIDADAYDYQQLLEYQDNEYTIYKSFFRYDGFVELYCEGVEHGKREN